MLHGLSEAYDLMQKIRDIWSTQDSESQELAGFGGRDQAEASGSAEPDRRGGQLGFLTQIAQLQSSPVLT